MTPEQVRALIEQVLVVHALPPWYVPIVSLFVGAVAGAALIWGGAYLRGKAERVARQEDLGKIVNELRHVTRAAEEIKASISGDLWVQQNRWTFKAETYRCLLETLSVLALNYSLWRRVAELQGRGGLSEGETRQGARQVEDCIRDIRLQLDAFWRCSAVARIWLSDAARDALRAVGEESSALGFAIPRSPQEVAQYLSGLEQAVRTARRDVALAAKQDLRLE